MKNSREHMLWLFFLGAVVVLWPSMPQPWGLLSAIGFLAVFQREA